LPAKKDEWKAGLGRRVITPQNDVWLAGYGTKRAPEGKIHDLWVKVLALRDPAGRKIVMATTDHMGMSRTIYESIFTKVNQRFGIERADFMLTYSHNHCGPCLTDDLVDYYPSDDAQKKAVDEYTQWMEVQVLDAVSDALKNWKTVESVYGRGEMHFCSEQEGKPGIGGTGNA
jgi:neutral ceramidase